MIEITPEVFTLIGIVVLLPLACFLPTILEEYCTGSLLSPLFTQTMNARTMIRMIRMAATFAEAMGWQHMHAALHGMAAARAQARPQLADNSASGRGQRGDQGYVRPDDRPLSARTAA